MADISKPGIQYGCHITSIDHYEQIKQSGGIVPYHITDHEATFVEAGYRRPVIGIWIWVRPLDKYSEFMNAIWHVQKKLCTRIVVLNIKYEFEDVLKNPKDQYGCVEHHISYGTSAEFYENEKAVLLRDKVGMDRIKLVMQYNFDQYIRFDRK